MDAREASASHRVDCVGALWQAFPGDHRLDHRVVAGLPGAGAASLPGSRRSPPASAAGTSGGRANDDLARKDRQHVLPPPRPEAGGLDLLHHVAQRHVEQTAILARVEGPNGAPDALQARAIAVGDEQLPAGDASKLVENHAAYRGRQQVEQAETDDDVDAPILERKRSRIALEHAKELSGIVL